VIRRSAGLPPRLLTAHGTTLFVAPGSGELAHGPVADSPANARLVSDGSHGQIMYEVAGSLRPIICRPNRSEVLNMDGKEGSTEDATVFAIMDLSNGRVALKAEGLFLCAEPDGRVTLSRKACGTWEGFVLAEPPSILQFSDLRHSNDLVRLAVKHGVDKWGSHWYAQHYHNHFSPLRDQKISLLEIGVGGYDNPRAGGGSLRMWEEYFPSAIIHGIDIFDKRPHEQGRVKIHQGSQFDENFLRSVFADAGSFDVIIDDGSHINAHVLKSFEVLFPLLSNNGVYAIEDVQTSYWPEFGGNSDDFKSEHTIVGFFKGLVDSLNYEEFIKPNYQPTYFDKHIVSMHFYHNLIVIVKGSNNEGSNTLRNNERV